MIENSNLLFRIEVSGLAFGSVLPESVDSYGSRKQRGAFFTPKSLADSISRFAITSRSDRVLEPACGEAVFLLSAAERLRGLGASLEEVNLLLRGNELHQDSVDAAQRTLLEAGLNLRITAGDFFDLNPSDEVFDAIIGNPPYIRYQSFNGSERAKAREAGLAAGVRIGSMASAWAPFVIHATRFLRTGGRLGFVLPAELLTVQYAAPIREYLLDNFAKVEVTLFEKPVFPEVQEEVVVLCASGFREGQSRCLFMSQADSVASMYLSKPFSADVHDGERWPIGKDSYTAQSVLSRFDGSGMIQLDQYGDVRLGAVTGSNRFFTMSETTVREFRFKTSDLVSICPPGSRHLRQLSFDAADLVALRNSGKAVYLFSPADMPSVAAESYISLGLSTGINMAYKCRKRNPWWRVPGLKVCDIFVTYMNGYGPNLCFNGARVAYLNSVHGLFLHKDVEEKVARSLPLVALSSATLLSAELVGRSYGGGILKLEPREASQMLVPSPGLIRDHIVDLQRIQSAVDSCLREGKRDEATLMVDEVLLPELGMSAGEIQIVHGALLELRTRRRERGKVVSIKEGE